MSETMYRCGCGEWTGEHCSWTGPLSEMVVVAWVPESLRASCVAAGGHAYWEASAVRVACCRKCADDLLAIPGEAEWAEITGTSPARYAEVLEHV